MSEDLRSIVHKRTEGEKGYHGGVRKLCMPISVTAMMASSCLMYLCPLYTSDLRHAMA